MALCDRVVFFVSFVSFELLTLLRTCNGADAPACVFAGSCILPCSFNPGEELVIHWIQMKTGYHTHSFYHQQDQFGQQDQSFRGRTSLFKDQMLEKGNASLQLRGVKIQDEGQYKCYTGTTARTKESFYLLKVYAPVHKVHIQWVENNITCSSEGVYPEPELTWTTSPQSNETLQTQPTFLKTEQELYIISSTLVDAAPDLDYSCTVRTRMSQRKATWFRPTYINGSDAEATILCRSSSRPPTGLIWRFNHSQILLNQTGSDYTVSEAWTTHVKSSSESGRLTLKGLTPNQEGIYTCELSDAEETFIRSSFLRLEESPGGKAGDSHNDAIAGGVVGAIVVLGIIAAAAAAFVIYRKKQTADQQPDGRNHEGQEMRPLKEDKECEANGSGEQNVNQQRVLEANEETDVST